MKHRAVSILGWYGVLAILSAYGLLSLGLIESRSITYQILNLTGAATLAYETINKRDFQPAVLNVVWALIAAVALLSLMLKS